MKRYKIGEIAKLTGLTVRTLRYYEEEGLIKAQRTDHHQRYYSDEVIIYIKRIMELKSLGFTLDEIRKIIELKSEDESGNKRRAELLSTYRSKLSESLERKRRLEAHIGELEWHIKQLEDAEDSFQECPGRLCEKCRYKGKCIFFRKDDEMNQ